MLSAILSCAGVTTLTTPGPCVDKDQDCARYQKDTCTNPQYAQWATEQCKKFCNLCSKYKSLFYLSFWTSWDFYKTYLAEKIRLCPNLSLWFLLIFCICVLCAKENMSVFVISWVTSVLMLNRKELKNSLRHFRYKRILYGYF